MRYIVQDTADGFRFTVESPNGRLLGQVDVPGSHSSTAQLYAHAERVSHDLRAQRVQSEAERHAELRTALEGSDAYPD